MISQQLEELDETHGGEEGVLAEAKTEKGKLTAKSVKERIKAIKGDREAEEERAVLRSCLVLLEEEAAAGKSVKDAQKALETKVQAQYVKLSESDIQTLIVDDKWIAILGGDVKTELSRVSGEVSSRITKLAERYAVELSQLEKEASSLTNRVNEHIKKLVEAWK